MVVWDQLIIAASLKFLASIYEADDGQSWHDGRRARGHRGGLHDCC